MLDIISEWQAIRANVWQTSLQCLNQAHVHELTAGSLDRRAHLTLPQGSLEYAREAIDALNAFADWLRELQPALSKREQNLFEASLLEIEHLILQDRPGVDLALDFYERLYRTDLRELLDLIEVIVDQSQERAGSSGWQARPYSRGVELTLGVEEEYKIVSDRTFELVPDAEKFFSKELDLDNASIDGEVYRSQLELKTGVCASLNELENTLVRARLQLNNRLPEGLLLLSAGTHPFSSWSKQEPSTTPRVSLFMHDMQDVVRQLLVSGLHVHVGISDRELAIKVIRIVRQYLPMILALSTSSPFWQSRPTGLMSYRRSVFSVLPRTGLPPTFKNYSEYLDYLQLLTKTRSFDSVGSSDPTKIWWDIRLHPKYPTLEFRVCDACTDVRDSIAIAGLIQALVGTIARMEYEGVSPDAPPRHIIEENMWRAARYGRNARYIDLSTGSAVSSHYTALSLLDFVDDTLEVLGTRELVRSGILRILTHGSSSDRQLHIYRETKKVTEVARYLTQHFVTV